jgi:hypothetical protein
MAQEASETSNKAVMAEFESKKRKYLGQYFPTELLVSESRVRGSKIKKTGAGSDNQLAKSSSLLSIAKLEHKEKKVQARGGAGAADDEDDTADPLGLTLKDEKTEKEKNDSDDEDAVGLADGEEPEEASDEDDYAVDHYASDGDGDGDDGLDGGDDDGGRDRAESF